MVIRCFVHKYFVQYPSLRPFTLKFTACYYSPLRPFDWLKSLTSQHLPFAFVVVFAGPLLSPLGVASVNSHGALDWDDDKIPTSDGIGVIGKGRLTIWSHCSDSFAL